jgi:outer membrane receptor for ferrienterochelin and colicins
MTQKTRITLSDRRTSTGGLRRPGLLQRCASCALAFLLVFAPVSARAQTDLDLELDGPKSGDEEIVFQEIPSVYGVSKFDQKITEAPSFVTLITSSEISKFGYRTLAEALQGVTGFFVTNDRQYSYLGIRGFNRPGDFNSRVLLLVDGHRLNDNLYDQAGLGTEAVIDMDLVDRIEVIRGPSSSLYGTNAFFGVINVITKRGRDVRGVELSGENGSFDSYRGRSTYGERFGDGVELLLSGSYYESQGDEKLFYKEFANPLTGNGISRRSDGDKFPNLFGKASYRDLTLQGGFVSREKEIPTGKYGTFFPTDQTRSTDEHGYLFAKYEHYFGSQLHVSGRVYYDRFYYRGDYLYDVALAPPSDLVMNRDRSTGEWWGSELKVNRRFYDMHNVTAGVEYRDNFRQDLFNGDVNPPAVVLDDRRDSWNTAAFLQDEIQLLDHWILNAGVRYDYYESFGNTINPRIALIYNRDASTVKLMYGTAFRGANAYERFYVGTGFKANPDLDPEQIRTYELVVERSLTRQLRATAAGYLYTIDDLVSQETDLSDGLLVFQNGGAIEARGVELQLEMDKMGRLDISGRIGYALQEAIDHETDRELTNSPEHIVNWNLSVPLWQDRIVAGVETLYTSRRRTLAGDHTNHHLRTNLTLLLRNLRERLEISLALRNLFDRKYSDPGSGEQVQDQIEQDGRTFWVKLKYRF